MEQSVTDRPMALTLDYHWSQVRVSNSPLHDDKYGRCRPSGRRECTGHRKHANFHPRRLTPIEVTSVGLFDKASVVEIEPAVPLVEHNLVV